MTKEAKIMFGIGGICFVAIVIMAIGVKSNRETLVGDILKKPSVHMTGSISARVTLVEFGDYQCPACASADPIVKQIIDAQKSNPDFNFMFKHFPLSQHKNAEIAAEAAEASGAQGKYWEMSSLLYEKQSEWAESSNSIDLFMAYAQSLGLDTGRFKDEVESSKYSDIIRSDLSDGLSLGVNSTPTFYLNGNQVTSLSSFEDLKSKVDSALAN